MLYHRGEQNMTGLPVAENFLSTLNNCKFRFEIYSFAGDVPSTRRSQ